MNKILSKIKQFGEDHKEGLEVVGALTLIVVGSAVAGASVYKLIRVPKIRDESMIVGALSLQNWIEDTSPELFKHYKEVVEKTCGWTTETF